MSERIERTSVPAMDAILGEVFPILDHGFIRVVDYMGDDAAIVQAARVSYGKGTKSVRGDRGLIRYLMRHWHSTPFEMCEIKLHVKLPMFVARQWIRHRTANVNEISARYSVLDREFYIPAPEQVASQSAINNQGRGEGLNPAAAAAVRETMQGESDRAYNTYLDLLGDDENPGVARELARATLPVSAYTQWYWKVDLHNLFHFLALRSDPHAQYEIRAYADVMIDIVKRWVPAAAEAFEDYRMDAFTLSGPMIAYLKARLAGDTNPDAEALGLSPREVAELLAVIEGE